MDAVEAARRLRQVPENRVRSVAERLKAESIMNKVGGWCEADRQYYTLEKQVQAKMSYFQGLHQSLKYSPSDDYNRNQSRACHSLRSISTIDEDLPTRKKDNDISSMSLSSQTSAEIDGFTYSRSDLEDLRRTHPLLKFSPVLEVVKQLNLNSPPDNPPCELSNNKVSEPVDKKIEKKEKKTIKEREPQLKRSPSAPELPKIGDPKSSNQYSSLLMQLKRTKKEVAQHGAAVNTVKVLLDIDGSAELKKTITRIFADPQHAAAISEAEAVKRQNMYQTERLRLQQQQQEELRDQRQELEKEIGYLLTELFGWKTIMTKTMDINTKPSKIKIRKESLLYAIGHALLGITWVLVMGFSTADVVFMAISMAIAGEHLQAGYWDSMTTEERSQSERLRCVVRTFLTSFLFVVISAIAERGGLFPTVEELDSAFSATWFLAIAMGGYSYIGRDAVDVKASSPPPLSHVEVPRCLMLYYIVVIALFLKKNFTYPSFGVLCASGLLLLAPDKSESELLFMTSLWWLGYAVTSTQ